MPPRAATRHKKVQRSQPQTHVSTRATFIISRAPMRHAPCADTRACAMTSWWCHPPYPGLTHLFRQLGLTRTDPKIWLGPNRLKQKMLWPNEPLTLIKKSKFSKRAYPTQFFAYIPILEFVSLFKIRKLCKLSKFQKVDFCTNFDQESKFSRRTYLALFFAKIMILGSISSFENPKLLK